MHQKTKKFTCLFYNKIVPLKRGILQRLLHFLTKSQSYAEKQPFANKKKGKNALEIAVLKIYGKAIGLRFWK